MSRPSDEEIRRQIELVENIGQVCKEPERTSAKYVVNTLLWVLDDGPRPLEEKK